MKTYRHLIFMTLLLCSSMAFAFPEIEGITCMGKGEDIAPLPVAIRTWTDSDGNRHDTDQFKDWKRRNGLLRINAGCCEHLKLNTTNNECQDTSIIDANKKICSLPGNHFECASLPGTGCFPITEDDMFKTDSSDPEVIKEMARKEETYEIQQNLIMGSRDPKETGERCFVDAQCASYSCERFKCQAPINICRFANRDDIASPVQVLCEDGLIKKNSRCVYDSDYYLGSVSSIITQHKPGGTQCEFELVPVGTDGAGNTVRLTPENLASVVQLAMKTTRSMEWLFATSSLGDGHDCLYTQEYMKKTMQDFVDARKNIVETYNTGMLFVEETFIKLNAAKIVDPPDLTQISTLCKSPDGHDEQTTMHDVASRKATGLDFLCYMQMKNDINKGYEQAMYDQTSKVAAAVDGYKASLLTWGEKDKNWSLGGTAYSSDQRDCRDRDAWNKKMKRRWTQKYQVNASNSQNQQTVNKAARFLDILGGAGTSASFNLKNYYLLDPLMPGGQNQFVNFEKFGDPVLLNGNDYKVLIGEGGIFHSSGLKEIHEKFSARILDHLKTIRNGTSPEKFIYEPELKGSYEMRGCLDNLDTEVCKPTRDYIAELNDYAFAQFLAYSRHSRQKYKNYFKNEGTWRHKLLSRYKVDLTNLQLYYEAISGPNNLRERQAACLNGLITQVTTDFATPEDVGSVAGPSSNYYNQTSSNYVGTGGRGANYNKPKIKNSNGTPKTFRLRAISNSFKYNGALKGGFGSKTGAGSGTVSNANIGNSALASRIKAMQDANKKAAASGVDLNAKAKDLQASMAKAGLLTGSGSGSSGARSDDGPGKTSSGAASGNQATLDPDPSANKNSDPNAGLGKDGMAAGANAGAYSGIAAGSASGYGSNSGPNSGSNAGDASGMSDEEKDRLAANYDRTKSEYKTNEDDSLFQVLSKTYVRNLDKILIRKKLSDDAASFPSDPSKP